MQPAATKGRVSRRPAIPEDAGAERTHGREWNVQGYIARVRLHRRCADHAHQLSVPPEPFVVAEAFRRIYADDRLDFRKLARYDLSILTASIKQRVNDGCRPISSGTSWLKISTMLHGRVSAEAYPWSLMTQGGLQAGPALAASARPARICLDAASRACERRDPSRPLQLIMSWLPRAFRAQKADPVRCPTFYRH